ATALDGVPVALQVERSGHFVTIRTALTNREGEYSFGDLPAGRYRVVPALDPDLAPGNGDAAFTISLGQGGPLRVRIDFNVHAKLALSEPDATSTEELPASIPTEAWSDIDDCFRTWRDDSPTPAELSPNDPAWIGGLALVAALALTESVGRTSD